MLAQRRCAGRGAPPRARLARAASSFRDGRRARTSRGSASTASGSSSRRTRSTSASSRSASRRSAADREALRERLGLDGCVFLYVGRLEREKGLDVLRRGDGRRSGAARARRLGTARGRAARRPTARAFVGQLTRDELVPWYAAADVLVLPSRSEPWGMTLNEGAAAGLPLVATDAVGRGARSDRARRQRVSRSCRGRGCARRGAADARVRRGASPPRRRALARAGRAVPAGGVGGGRRQRCARSSSTKRRLIAFAS